MKKLISLFFLSFMASSSYAILQFENAQFPEFVTSARALAMGNAYIAKVDDPWAAFYNPAGLGTVRKTTFHLFNLHLEGNNGVRALVDSTQATDIPKHIAELSDEKKLYDLMNANKGTTAHTRVNFFPNLTTRFFQIGWLFSQQNMARLANTATASFEMAERRDMGPMAAVSLPLFGGIIKLGLTGQYLYRRELQKDFASGSTIQLQDSDYSKGEAFILTGGGKITLPIAMLPTFAAVIRNAGSQDFKQTGSSKPTKIEQTVDLGFSLTPQFGKQFRMHMEVNYRDINDKYGVNAQRRLGAGVEFDYARKIFLRFGYGDGWGSGGLGIRTSKIIIDLTTYAVEMGSSNQFRSVEDRRFVLSLSSGF